MIDLIAALDALHRAGKMHGLTIWPTGGGGYQVNLATSAPNSFRVRRADTPSEGLRLVLEMDLDKIDEAIGMTAPSNGYRGFESKEAYEAHYSDPAAYVDELPSMQQYTDEAAAEREAAEQTDASVFD